MTDIERLFFKLGRAVYNADYDRGHYWRCEAWPDENGKRRARLGGVEENCDCGLTAVVRAENAVYRYMTREHEPRVD